MINKTISLVFDVNIPSQLIVLFTYKYIVYEKLYFEIYLYLIVNRFLNYIINYYSYLLIILLNIYMIKIYN